jgi:hypothetical protein
MHRLCIDYEGLWIQLCRTMPVSHRKNVLVTFAGESQVAVKARQKSKLDSLLRLLGGQGEFSCNGNPGVQQTIPSMDVMHRRTGQVILTARERRTLTGLDRGGGDWH